MRRIVIAIAAGFLVLAALTATGVAAAYGRGPLAGVAADYGYGPRIKITGTVWTPWDVTKYGFDVELIPDFGDPCTSAEPGFTDIKKGMSVSVRGDDGEVVGVGKLKPGRIKSERNMPLLLAKCVFAFTTYVKSGQDLYTIKLGSHETELTRTDLRKPVRLVFD